MLSVLGSFFFFKVSLYLLSGIAIWVAFLKIKAFLVLLEATSSGILCPQNTPFTGWPHKYQNH